MRFIDNDIKNLLKMMLDKNPQNRITAKTVSVILDKIKEKLAMQNYSQKEVLDMSKYESKNESRTDSKNLSLKGSLKSFNGSNEKKNGVTNSTGSIKLNKKNDYCTNTSPVGSLQGQ